MMASLKRTTYLSGKGGRNAYGNFGGNSSGTGSYVASLGATALTGSGKNHFELGIGLGRFFDSIIEDGETDINFDND